MIAAALWGRIRTPRRLCRIAPVVRPLMAWSRACWVRGLSTISTRLVALADDVQRRGVGVAAEVGEVGVAGFGDTQAVDAEQADQAVGMSAFVLGSAEEVGELVAIQPRLWGGMSGGPVDPGGGVAGSQLLVFKPAEPG